MRHLRVLKPILTLLFMPVAPQLTGIGFVPACATLTDSSTVSFNVAFFPVDPTGSEPSTFLLVGIGLILLFAMHYASKKLLSAHSHRDLNDSPKEVTGLN